MIRQILQWMDNLSVPALRRSLVLCLSSKKRESDLN